MFDKRHFSGFHKIAGFHTVDVDAAGQVAGIKIDLVTAGRKFVIGRFITDYVAVGYALGNLVQYIIKRIQYVVGLTIGFVNQSLKIFYKGVFRQCILGDRVVSHRIVRFLLESIKPPIIVIWVRVSSAKR